MTEELVLYETDDKIGLVTLNRPQKLNALNNDMRSALSAALRRADDDDATSVVVLRGAGRSFCVGYDIGGGGAGNEPWRNDALKFHDRLNVKSRHRTAALVHEKASDRLSARPRPWRRL